MQVALNGSAIRRMEGWGYHLLEQIHPHSPGYTGVMIAIRSNPTGHHYDPEMVRLPVLGTTHQVEETTLNLFTRLAEPLQVCMGFIVLADRKNKQEAFFSFGGRLELEIAPGEVVYTISSDAPVLWLTRGGGSVADQLAAEFGRVIGEIRAQANKSDQDLFTQIAGIEPLALYSAGIASIFADFERVEELRESYPELHDLLHEEKGWLTDKGLWAQNPTTLAELLGINS